MSERIVWPDGKSFAFTIFDDTDLGTVENLAPVYDLFLNSGIRSTKSVWVLPGTEPPALNGGETCDNPEYLKWVLGLQKAGVEIGWHNATFHSSRRPETLEGMKRFNEMFGHYPRSMANHTVNKEGIYWGEQRLGGWRRATYNVMTKGKGRGHYEGHLPGSEYFWGDLCKSHIKYVRNFVMGDINTLKTCPWMPYVDPARPYVNAFFASSEGGDVGDFCKTISEENQDRLEAEGGCCIMYAHCGMGFWQDGAVNPKLKALVQRLSRKNGWFAPVTDVLDHIKSQRGLTTLNMLSRTNLECRWLSHKVRVGAS